MACTLEVLQRGGHEYLTDITAKYRDVNVFRKVVERGAALEKQARASLIHSVEEGVERPAYPEVFFDVLNRRSKTCGRLCK